jgi:hypothetical protein
VDNALLIKVSLVKIITLGTKQADLLPKRGIVDKNNNKQGRLNEIS